MKQGTVSKSFFFNIFSSITAQIVTFITSIVLARILFPEDFGYLVTAQIFEGVFTLFALDGFETYYMQKKCSDEEEDLGVLATTWFFRLALSGVLFVIQIIISLVIIFFSNKLLGEMLFVLSFLHLTSIIGRTKEVYLSKKLDFAPIAKSNVLRDVSSAAVKIIFALLGFGPLSFVYGQVLGATAKGFYLLKQVSIKIKPKLDKLIGKEVFKFGFSVFTTTIGGYLIQQTDRILLASYYSFKDTGIYQFSKNQSMILNAFAIYPQSYLVMNYFAGLKNDKEQSRKRLDQLGLLLNTFATPVFLILLLYSKYYIPFIFGEKWMSSIPVFNMFLIYYYFQFISYPANAFLTINGEPEKKAKIYWTVFPVFIAAMVYLAYIKVPIYYYALVFSSAYTTIDILVGAKGLKHLNYGYTKFLIRRFGFYKFIIPQLLIIGGIYVLDFGIPFYFNVCLTVLVLWLTLHLFDSKLSNGELKNIADTFFPDKYRKITRLIFLRK